MANWYLKGGSIYDNGDNCEIWFYLNLDGFAEEDYDSQTLANREEKDPFVLIYQRGTEVSPDPVIEIGLHNHYRIKIDDSGIYGWDEVLGSWIDLLGKIPEGIGQGKGATEQFFDIDSVITNITTRSTSLHDVLGNRYKGWYVCNGVTTTDLVALGGAGELTAPDLIGIGAGNNRFLRGNSTQGLATGTGGAATHVLSIAELAVHTHIQNQHRHLHKQTSAYAGIDVRSGHHPIYGTSQWGNYTTATNQNTGSGDAHNNEPQYKDVIRLIKLLDI